MAPSAPHVKPRPARLFLVAALLLTAVLLLFASSVRSYVVASRWVDHTLEVRKEVYEWLTALVDAETGVRGYLATDQALFLEPYEEALVRERAIAARLQSLVADNSEQAAHFEVADHDAQVTIADLKDRVALARRGQRGDALLGLNVSKARMDQFRSAAGTIRMEEERTLAERRTRASQGGLAAATGAFSLAFASCLLLALAWRREGTHRRLASALAAEASDRLQALSNLAVALSNTRTRSQVAEVVVEHAMLVAHADTCTLYELDGTGKVLELIGHRGVVPEVLETIRRITETAGNPGAFATMRTGATWAEDEVDYARIYPALAKMRSTGRRAKAFWSVPLVAEGTPLGLLGVGFYEPRKFPQAERDVVGTLTKHCAQALLRAARLEREDEARRWFTTTLRSIGDAVIATNPEGRVTFLNPVAEALTGWVEQDARGRPLDEVFSIFSEQTRKVVESPVTKVLREGTVVGLANHTVLRSKRGSEIPIDDSGAPIRNETGQIVGVVLVFRDVTLEKRHRVRSEFLAKAGEALVASIDLDATFATVARLAVPTLADWCAIDIVDADGAAPRQVAVAHVDESMVRLARELGERYPPDPNARSGVHEVIRTSKPELYAEIPKAMLEASARDPEHLRLLHTLRLESAMVVPLRARGRCFGAMSFVYADSGRRYNEDDLAFAEDFARRAAMAIDNALALREAEMARAQERTLRGEAEKASRAKDEFLAIVSHELRTPLNAILGWTVTLRRRKVAEDVDRALSIVERNARLQTKLIEDVLDISRIISGKLALNIGPTNVGEAVSAAIETVTPAAEAKNISTSIDVPDEALTISADADRLQQIAWNLLANAVKFTPKNGSVAVRAYREGSEVCLSVKDTGEGMSRDVLPLVFEPFQQADASTTRRHGGLGLGLAIVKRLVAAHGGTVHAESEGEGRGSTFTVRLPARSAVPAVARAARPANTSPAVQGATEDAPRLDGLRLLVVDDEEDALKLVSEVLRDQGAEVHVATSAREALSTFATVRPDVVVSDIGMPDADGFFLIRKIRSLPPERGGRTPAVALTAYARTEDAQRAFAAGYQRHVPKPVEPTKLATIVANLGGLTLDAAGDSAPS
jgi:PAS domain S-box-containing protein